MAINREKTLLEAQKLVDKKKFDKAIAEYQKVIADDPNDVRTLLKVGDLFLRMQQFAEAIATYDRVAQYYSVQGFSVKAVAVFKQMREIIQKHAPHLEDRFGHIVPKLAELLTQLDLRSDALAYYDEWASRLQAGGRERDAIDIFKKITQLDPGNPVSHLRLADAYARVRDFDGAAVEFGEAAELLLKLGRQDDALRVVERLLQYRQEGRFARLAASIHLERGQPTDGMAALTKLQIAFKENPRDLETLALLARAFDALGQGSKSIEVQKEACRIAREGGDQALFDTLLQSLIERAPNDEGVRQLIALAAGADSKASSLPPQPQSAALPSLGQGRALTGRGQAFTQQQGTPSLRTSEGPMSGAPMSAMELSQSDIQVDEPSLVDQSVVELDDGQDIEIDAGSFEAGYGEEPPASEADEAPFALRTSHPPPELDPVRLELNRADAYRRRGTYADAALVLRQAIAAFPTSRELRERLCDVLIESGDQDAAVEEMLGFAQHLVSTNDPDAAARLLDEVLLLDTHNRAALAMLRDLGYAVPGVDDSLDPPADVAQVSSGAPIISLPAYDPLEPLPSYDLDELTADELPIPPPSVGGSFDGAFDGPDSLSLGPNATMRSKVPAPPFPARGSAPAIELDDPFGSEDTNFGIPAYPLDDLANAASAPPAIPPLRQSRTPAALDEAALEEIEFFATHEMLDEALNLLNEQLSRLPSHPLLLEKKREVEALRAQLSSAPPSLARETARPTGDPDVDYAAHSEMPASSAHPRSTATRELHVDRAYDIAHALDEMDQAMESFGPSPEPAPDLGSQVSVETVFEQFKAGVAAQIAEGDAATHYDLGVAYKEMGLIQDAIHEFELASRDPTRECVCQSMIGMLHLANGNLDVAIDAFIRGLHASEKTPDQELALTYEIGNAYEMRNNLEQSVYYFQLVARSDPSYRDPRGSVAERIAGLERRIGGSIAEPSSPKAVAVGGDEFDAAFDDLFNPKG